MPVFLTWGGATREVPPPQPSSRFTLATQARSLPRYIALVIRSQRRTNRVICALRDKTPPQPRAS